MAELYLQIVSEPFFFFLNAVLLMLQRVDLGLS